MNRQQSAPLVCIIILNWNGWKDTLECLASLEKLDYPNYEVVVVDNGSTDGSESRIRKAYRYITLLQTGKNLGFAGGNNTGIRYALSRHDFDYVWLLNNDTVVEPDALKHMVRRMQERPDAGICGSTLLYYYDKSRVQALGGATYNKWLGTSRHIGAFQKTSAPIDQVKVEARMKYVIGASMLVSKPFLEEVGLMSEDYFLYFEDLDWATRAADRYSLAYAAESIVFHKEGKTSGASNRMLQEKSLVADYYGIRNRLLFTRKFFPYALPTVYLALLITIINRIRRGQWERVRMVADICLST